MAGAIAQLYNFDAYGNAIGFNPAEALTEFLYSGEQFDAKIGQQYLRQRYYDPSTGRFNRLDPFFGNHTDPQSFHKYLYCVADPVMYSDPSGLTPTMSLGMAMMIGAKIGGIGGAAAGTVYGTYLGYKNTGTLFSTKTLLYAGIGAISGALVGSGLGALGGALYTFAMTGTIAPFTLRNELLVAVHPTVIPAFYTGVLTGVSVGLFYPDIATASIIALVSGGSAGLASHYETLASKEQLWNLKNWRGRSISPYGIARTAKMWAIPFTTGFIIGYIGGTATRNVADSLVNMIEPSDIPQDFVE